jgi:hypothetical protein
MSHQRFADLLLGYFYKLATVTTGTSYTIDLAKENDEYTVFKAVGLSCPTNWTIGNDLLPGYKFIVVNYDLASLIVHNGTQQWEIETEHAQFFHVIKQGVLETYVVRNTMEPSSAVSSLLRYYIKLGTLDLLLNGDGTSHTYHLQFQGESKIIPMGINPTSATIITDEFPIWVVMDTEPQLYTITFEPTIELKNKSISVYRTQTSLTNLITIRVQTNLITKLSPCEGVTIDGDYSVFTLVNSDSNPATGRYATTVSFTYDNGMANRWLVRTDSIYIINVP